MGATTIKVYANGVTMHEAFNNAQEEAEQEYGHDSYNGAINNCDLVRDVTSLAKSKSRNELISWIIDNTSKREVMGFCIKEPKSNTNKIKSAVQRIAQKGTRKFETVYVAYEGLDKQLCTGKTLGECIDKARDFVEKRGPGRDISIYIEKRLVKGNSKCAVIEYKPSKNEQTGTYIFAGWAPC